MAAINRNSEATFRVFLKSDETYGVEVTIPETCPAFVSGFSTETAAEDWIADYKRKVEAVAQRGPRSWRNRRG